MSQQPIPDIDAILAEGARCPECGATLDGKGVLRPGQYIRVLLCARCQGLEPGRPRIIVAQSFGDQTVIEVDHGMLWHKGDSKKRSAIWRPVFP